MKIEVKPKQPEFEPIELTLTIESSDELESLWHRFSVGNSVIRANASNIKQWKEKIIFEHTEIFEKLNELAIERGMR
jgi:hypothetical protein